MPLAGARVYNSRMLKNVIMREIGRQGEGSGVILKIIWRVFSALRAALLGVSAKRSMSGHRQNVRQPSDWGANPDKMIVGRENGSARHAGGIRAGCATYHSKCTAAYCSGLAKATISVSHTAAFTKTRSWDQILVDLSLI